MKKIIIFLPFFFALSTFAQQNLSLRYTSPSKVWEATLPLGNGRIGMMPDGGIDSEKIVLNDITMWSGSEDVEALNPDAIRYLPQISELLLAGKNLDAQKIMYEHFRCGGKGSAFGNGKDAPYGCFQMLGNVNIRYDYRNANTSASNYEFSLNLSEALASTQFDKGNTQYTREYFASHADDVMVIRLTANKKRAIGFTIELSRPERAEIYTEKNRLYMDGQLNDGHNGGKGVRFYTEIKVINKGGKLVNSNKSISLANADEAFIIISSSSDMLDKNYKETVKKLLSNASTADYKKLKNNHIKAYQ